jgi:hypothetical protein
MMIRVRSPRLLALVALLAAIVAASMPSSVSAVSGTQPWVVVLCKFTDLSGEPHPASFYDPEYEGTGASALDFVDYWSDVSYGALNVAGTTVVSKWYSLGTTRYEWAGLNRYNKIRTCADTAASDVNYANYYGVVALFNDDSAARTASTSLSGAIGAGDTTINVASSAGFPAPPFAVTINDGSANDLEELHVTAVSGTTWTVTRGYENFNPANAHASGAPIMLIDGGDLGSWGPGLVGITLGGNNFNLGLVVGPEDYNLTGLAHETGHGFGYNHSRKLSTSTTDYNDCYDIMSAYATCSFSGDFGESQLGSVNAAAGPGLTGILLDLQGWMPAPRVFTLDNTACNQATLDLAGLNYAAVAGFLVAKVPAALTIPTPGGLTTTSQHYWLEYRDKSGWDNGLPASAVVLHLRGADGFAYWVDGAAGDGDLRVGEEYVDAGQNTYVAVNSIDTTLHQARVTLAGCKLNATLAYSGATSGQFSDQVTLAGDLTVSGSGAPVPSEAVSFTLGAQSCSAVTDAAGHASCTVTLNQVPGAYTVSSSFAGNSAYNAAADSDAFALLQEVTQVTYTGPAAGDYHDPVTLSGTLVDPDASGGPIAGRSLSFTIGATDTCSGTTNGAGAASCTLTPEQVPAPYSVVTQFSGDAFYLASSDSDPFEITKEETVTTYTGPLVIAQGLPVTLSAHLEEDTPVPVAGRTMTLRVGLQSCTGVTDAGGNASCTIAVVTAPLGSQPLAAEFAGDAYYLPSGDTATAIVFAFPSRGAFVLGDAAVAAATPATSLTWWSHSWSSVNGMSGGPGPNAFKGFAGSPSPTPPACGGTWTSRPGNSTPPVDAVPSYMGVLVASGVAKDGSTISGNIVKIVVVLTDAGYGPSPGHPGTGRIVATYCG